MLDHEERDLKGQLISPFILLVMKLKELNTFQIQNETKSLDSSWSCAELCLLHGGAPDILLPLWKGC